MAIDSFIEPAEPGSGNAPDDSHAAPILQAGANAALKRWLQDHPDPIFESTIGVGLVIGVMVVFELTGGHSGRRGLLIGVITVAHLVLLGLCARFLTMAAGESTLVTVPQSAKLIAVSSWQGAGAVAPAGVDRAKWAVAFEQSVRQLFPVS